jgi:ABC-type antimicrobial peptide transport system permease subunit
MRKFLSMFLRHWAKSPVKISLTILSVALGTGILVLSFSVSALLRTEVTDQLQKGGTVLYVQNGTVKSDGTIERVDGRPQWDSDAPAKVKSDVAGVEQAVVVSTTPFDQVQAAGKSWRVRSAIGSAPAYFGVFGLKLVTGLDMTDADVDSGAKKIWLSDEFAKVIWGSAEAALGQTVQPPGRLFPRGPGEDKQNLIQNYVVAGVYATPSEVNRRSYGIGDAVVPYTSVLPAGANATLMKSFFSSTFAVRAVGVNDDKLASSIRSALAASYGDTVSVAVWEGSPRGASTYLQELRQAVSIFTVSVNVLGVVLLLISSLGIFSVMVVESLGRRKEISLERALGASQALVLGEFWGWSVGLSLLGALIGLVFAWALSGPVLGTLTPLVGEVSSKFQGAAGLDLGAVAAGLLLALGCGGVLGLLPAFSAVRGTISETLREA